jgi:hypothetical protein
MPDSLQALVLAVAAAALVPAAAVLLFGWPWRRSRPWPAAAGGLLGVAAGLAAGCWLLEVRPHWPPREDYDRLLFVLLPVVLDIELLLVLGQVFTGHGPRSLLPANGKIEPKGGPGGRWGWPMWLPRLAVAAGAGWMLLYDTSYLKTEWAPAQKWMVLGAMAAALVAMWCSLGALVRHAPGRSVPLVLALACVGAGAAVMLSGYYRGGLIGLLLGSALSGAVIASVLLSRIPDMQGIVAVGVVGLFAVVVIGRFFGELTTAHAVLLFFAPLLCWLPELPHARRLGPRMRGLLRIALAAAPVVLVLLLARQQFIQDSARTSPGSPTEPSEEDYSNFGK